MDALTESERELACDHANMAMYRLISDVIINSGESHYDVSEKTGINPLRIRSILAEPGKMTVGECGIILRAYGYWFFPNAMDCTSRELLRKSE